MSATNIPISRLCIFCGRMGLTGQCACLEERPERCLEDEITAERHQCCADVCHGCAVALPLAWTEDCCYHTQHDGAGKFRCDAFKIHLRARTKAVEVEEVEMR